MAKAAGAAVEVEGLKDLRRALKGMERTVPRALTEGLKRGAEPVRARAAALAPHRTGRLAASVKVSARGASVGIGSRLPYANVVHWGGTTGRGHRPGVAGSGSVKVSPSPFIEEAAEQAHDAFAQGVTDELNDFARRYGWGLESDHGG